MIEDAISILSMTSADPNRRMHGAGEAALQSNIRTTLVLSKSTLFKVELRIEI